MGSIFGNSVLFENPKPVGLIEHIVALGADPDAIDLDFFAGASTTAHAVMAKNAKDGGSRKFIMVQLPETTDGQSEAFKARYSTIAEISKERIRRAGAKVLEGACHPDWNKDIGFRVSKVDTSNMQDVYCTPGETRQADLLAVVDNIKLDRTAEDLLFQVLVDWGVDLTLPIRRETMQGKTVFFVDDTALAACFETGISEALVKELAGTRAHARRFPRYWLRVGSSQDQRRPNLPPNVTGDRSEVDMRVTAMKLKFKLQPYQTDAVKAVVDCFVGQLRHDGISYRIDPGRAAQVSSFEEGFKNTDIQLRRVRGAGKHPAVQKRQNLPLSDKLVASAGCQFQSRHRDGDGHGQDLLLHQDDVRAEQAVWLVEVHRRGAQHRHPRGREEVVRDHGRALPGSLRQEGARSSSTTPSSCTSWRAFRPTPAST